MSDNLPQKRIAWIDAVKGACILLVVIYHTVYFVFDEVIVGDMFAYKLWYAVVMALKPLRMPLFFLISGYLAYSAIFSRSWRLTRRPRIGMMMWLYGLWMAIQWLTAVLLAIYADNSLLPYVPDMAAQEFVKALVIGNNSVWYLYALALYFIVFKACRRYPIVTLVGAAVVSAIADFAIEQWSIQSIGQNAVFFAIGCYGRDFIARHFIEFNIKRFLILSLLALLFLPLTAAFHLLHAPGVRLALAMLMVFATMDLFALLTQNFSLYLLQEIGRRTLPIYVIHICVILILCQWFRGMQFNGGAFSELILLALPILLTIANISICLGLHHLLNRYQGRILFTFPSRILF